MSRSKRVHLGLMPLALSGALLAACNLQGPPSSAEKRVSITTLSGAATTDAVLGKSLGLVQADAGVTAEQLQVKDEAGNPLAGAEVLLGETKLVADARGVVALPDAYVGKKQIPAVVRAAGHTPMVLDVVPGQAIPMPAIDAARTAISASSGGTAINAAGTMQVTFPPGSLTGDANVAVTRTYGQNGLPGQHLPEQIPFLVSAQKDAKAPLSLNDAGYKMADHVPIGTYHYSFDLGEGIEIAPGADVVVKFKAEGRMKELLDRRAAAGDDFASTSEAISRDGNGDYWLAMRIQGPKLAAGGASAKRKLLGAECQSFNDQEAHTFLVQKQWGALNPGIEVPIWSNGYRTRGDVSANWVNDYAAASGGHCVDSGSATQYENNGWNMQDGSAIPGWITLMTHNGGFNGGRCVYYQFDPNQYFCQNGRIYVRDPGQEWQTTYTTWISNSINAAVNWLSDDPRISGPVAGARVDFAHSLSPLRGAPMSIYTGGDGYASTIGVQNSYGSATASLPGQGYVYGTTAGYNVDCRTVGLNIVKNMPRVNVQGTLRGNWSGAMNVPTNLGTYALANTPSAQLKPSIPTSAGSASFQIDGSYQPNANTWIDAFSNAVTVTWNGVTNLPTNLWVSGQTSTTLSYGSDDNGALPGDQTPASKWGGQAASGASITFAHDQSGYAKKTRSEPLSFQNVGSASTWGLMSAGTTITATRALNGITLSGSATGTVGNGTIPCAIQANLPVMNFDIDGIAATGFVMSYSLRDAAGAVTTRTMKLPAASGGVVSVRLPIEEAVGMPGDHVLTIDTIVSEDFHNKLSPISDNAFPLATGLHRGGTYKYPITLKSTVVAPK